MIYNHYAMNRERQYSPLKEVFTSVYHLLNEELLLICHNELNGKKATEPDVVTKEINVVRLIIY